MSPLDQIIRGAIDGAKIHPDDFEALIKAVKDKFEGLPDDKRVAGFVLEWVAKNYPKGTPAVFSLALMRRYVEFVRKSG